MNKLISYAIRLAIAIAFLYFVGFIIASIISIVAWAISKYIAYLNFKKQYTEWEFDCEDYPLVSTLPNGREVFQHVETFKRYNNFEGRWEFKTVIDPVKRPFDKASSMSDRFFLASR